MNRAKTRGSKAKGTLRLIVLCQAQRGPKGRTLQFSVDFDGLTPLSLAEGLNDFALLIRREYEPVPQTPRTKGRAK